jgi:hypothetical protein
MTTLETLSRPWTVPSRIVEIDQNVMRLAHWISPDPEMIARAESDYPSVSVHKRVGRHLFLFSHNAAHEN